jgi:hypothetical protein
MLNKRAQASDALVWIIVTLAIVVILTIFMFVSGLFATTKGKIIDIKNVFTSKDLTDVDLIAAKNKIALDTYPPVDIASVEEWSNEAIA